MWTLEEDHALTLRARSKSRTTHTQVTLCNKGYQLSELLLSPVDCHTCVNHLIFVRLAQMD